jgi:hypothetical protein
LVCKSKELLSKSNTFVKNIFLACQETILVQDELAPKATVNQAVGSPTNEYTPC